MPLHYILTIFTVYSDKNIQLLEGGYTPQYQRLLWVWFSGVALGNDQRIRKCLKLNLASWCKVCKPALWVISLVSYAWHKLYYINHFKTYILVYLCLFTREIITNSHLWNLFQLVKSKIYILLGNNNFFYF